jgi:hypothetical protein
MPEESCRERRASWRQQATTTAAKGAAFRVRDGRRPRLAQPAQRRCRAPAACEQRELGLQRPRTGKEGAEVASAAAAGAVLCAAEDARGPSSGAAAPGARCALSSRAVPGAARRASCRARRTSRARPSSRAGRVHAGRCARGAVATAAPRARGSPHARGGAEAGCGALRLQFVSPGEEASRASRATARARAGSASTPMRSSH